MTNSIDSTKQTLFRKGDFILLILLLCLACILLFFTLGPQRKGAKVTVTVDGAVYGCWSLSDNQQIDIVSDYGTNQLQICDGTASVQFADCPDLICVHHVPISHAGERIVCLPNRMIVSIDATTDASKTDALSQ